jgi:transcriptional regulator with XRE-family HTH domain
MESSYSFGRWLSRARHSAGVSLRQLAERAETDFRYIQRIEAGKHVRPSRQMVLRLADALSIPAAEALVAAGHRLTWSERTALTQGAPRSDSPTSQHRDGD